MRALFILLLLLGLEGQALAHEEPAPLSTDPIDWLLPGVAYVLPGMLLAVLLNEYASRIGLFWRIVFAILFPFFFWFIVLYFLFRPDRYISDLIADIPMVITSDSMLILLVPSSAMIAASGFFDHRRRQKTDNAEVFADL